MYRYSTIDTSLKAALLDARPTGRFRCDGIKRQQERPQERMPNADRGLASHCDKPNHG
jgi:hypothetical protein